MFDRSSRQELIQVKRDTIFGPIAGTRRGLASPGPGSHDPLRPKKTKPSYAGFNSSAKTVRGVVEDSSFQTPSLAPSVIGHQAIPVRTNAKNPRSFDTTRPRTTSAHFTRHLDVPGPGSYEVTAEDFVRPTTAKVGAVAAPPQPPSQLHPALQAVRQLMHKNPPSMPSKLDYGYEIADGRRLVAQAPPPELVPRSSPPTATTYAPSERLTRPASAAATARYASDRTARVGFESFADQSTPGPGAYNLPTGLAAAPKPSDRLLSAVFASRCRKGATAIIPRQATGARVGPGTHYNPARDTGFGVGSARVDHNFGARRPRFAPDLSQPRSFEDDPGPGEYDPPRAIDEAAKRAKDDDWRLQSLWSRRTAAQRVGAASRGPAVGPAFQRRFSADDTAAAEAAAARLPAAAFQSTLPRFEAPLLSPSPPPTAYFRDDEGPGGGGGGPDSPPLPLSTLRRAVSASATVRLGGARRGASPPPEPRNIVTTDSTQIALQDAARAGGGSRLATPQMRGGSASAFGSTAPRFHRRGVHNAVAGERLDLPAVGPHSYESAAPLPSLRTRIAAASPSPFFRTGTGGADAAAAQAAAAALAQSSATSTAAQTSALQAAVDAADIRTPLARATFSRSASRGAHSSLSPERPPFPLKPREEFVLSQLPGPGSYDVNAGGTGLALPQPADPAAVLLSGGGGASAVIRAQSALSSRLASSPARAALLATATTAFPLLQAQAQAAHHHPGGAVALALTEPRFRDPPSRALSPPPTAYNPRPAADGATKRTFNVALASNEARSILFRQQH